MKLSALALAAVLSVSSAFVTKPGVPFLERISNAAPVSRARTAPFHMAVDPSAAFNDLQHSIPAIQHAFSSVLLSDEAVAVAGDAADAVADAGSSNGWFGFLTMPIEYLLQIIHSALVGAGLTANSWGVSIILMTCIIKLGTYPLTKNQMQSTTKMQMMQPMVKGIQAKYQSNPEVMNKKISELYSEEGVNPLAGCLPAIVQLPVFIGLYRAVLELAKNNVLNEPFLWLPSLEGPVYGADPAHGSEWITSGWVDFTPSLGWPETLAFLTIPVILVASQLVSQELMQPKNPDGTAPEGNAVLKFLPFLIGYFSLNVPSALGVYWVINNVITTAISVQIRNSMPQPAAATGGAAVIDAPKASFTPAPMREKPSGFASTVSPDDIKPITPMDAEIVIDNPVPVEDEGVQMPPTVGKSKKRGKKRKKRN